MDVRLGLGKYCSHTFIVVTPVATQKDVSWPCTARTLESSHTTDTDVKSNFTKVFEGSKCYPYSDSVIQHILTSISISFPFLAAARCSSVVRAFAHGAMGRRIDPSWCRPIELSFLLDGAYKRTLAVNRKE